MVIFTRNFRNRSVLKTVIILSFAISFCLDNAYPCSFGCLRPPVGQIEHKRLNNVKFAILLFRYRSEYKIARTAVYKNFSQKGDAGNCMRILNAFLKEIGMDNFTDDLLIGAFLKKAVPVAAKNASDIKEFELFIKMGSRMLQLGRGYSSGYVGEYFEGNLRAFIKAIHESGATGDMEALERVCAKILNEIILTYKSKYYEYIGTITPENIADAVKLEQREGGFTVEGRETPRG